MSKWSGILNPFPTLLQPVVARMCLININPQLLVVPVLVPYLCTDSSLLLPHIYLYCCNPHTTLKPINNHLLSDFNTVPSSLTHFYNLEDTDSNVCRRKSKKDSRKIISNFLFLRMFLVPNRNRER
jgi:hypothetical protein